MRRALLCIVLTTTPAFAADVVTPTGQLDFELVQRDVVYLLRDAAYEITFPGKPTTALAPFKYQDQEFQSLYATWSTSLPAVGFLVKPMPKSWTGSAATVLEEARDGMLQGANATLTKQTTTTLVGLHGNHVSAIANTGGAKSFVEADLLWDREHRVVIGLITVDETAQRNAAARAFVASFAVRSGTPSPIDPDPLADGDAIKAGVLGLEVVRHGATYVVRDGITEATFPERPTFHNYPVSPLTLVSAMASSGEIESLAVSVLAIPDDQAYDPVKGFAGERDGLVKEFSGEHHTEVKAKVGGLDGWRIDLTGTYLGVPARTQIRVVWDAKHRRLLTVMAVTADKKLSARAFAFLDSLAIVKTP